MTSLSLLRAMNIGFFSALVGLLFGAGRPIGFWLLLSLVLNFEDLCTNLLVHRAASISLEEKDSFSKNTLYSSDTMKTNVNKQFLPPLGHNIPRFSRGISLRRRPGLHLSTIECSRA